MNVCACVAQINQCVCVCVCFRGWRVHEMRETIGFRGINGGALWKVIHTSARAFYLNDAHAHISHNAKNVSERTRDGDVN